MSFTLALDDDDEFRFKAVSTPKGYLHQNSILINLRFYRTIITRGSRATARSEWNSYCMQILCHIFPILSVKQFLVLEKKNVFIIIFSLYLGMKVNGVWPIEQTLNPV